MLGNRYAQHSFAQIPEVHIPRSQFDRSFAIKDTFNFDNLTPIYCDEVLPGDTFNLTLNAFARLSTQVVPLMDNLYIDFFFFFVPNRLVWDNWEKLNGAQDNPGDSIDYVVPQITAPGGGGFTVDSIYDKFGLPTGVNSLVVKNALPLRAYNLIWNTWFRDENLQNSVTVQKDNGPDNVANYTLLKRGKRHDYFTSALPWPQKGNAVTLPLGTTAPVLGLGLTGTAQTTTTITAPRESDLTSNNFTGWGVISYNETVAAGKQYLAVETSGTAGYPNIRADLSNATAATINQLRQAIQVQSLLELDARGGTRYVEILRSHFGVISPDFRLQRPEYLGGGEATINISAVPNTTSVGTQAKLAAYGTLATKGNHIGFTKSFVEHGHIIGLACPRADITYQQGLNKMWLRSTRYDFFWPRLQQLGEQAVLNKEIYATGLAADDNVFGYQERYAEYRYKPSEIHGRFRSTYSTPLDMWHMAEYFGSAPALNSTFIQQSTPINRLKAVTTEPDILFDAFFQLKCARPMMTYSVPAQLGRL